MSTSLGEYVYNRPVPKTAPTTSFCLRGILRLYVPKRGRIKIEKSERIFTADEERIEEFVERMEEFEERQVPGIDGFQSFSRGLQAKAKTKSTDR